MRMKSKSNVWSADLLTGLDLKHVEMNGVCLPNPAFLYVNAR